MTDLIIRGAETDIAVDDGTITAIAPALPAGRREIDARALAVLPGVIDVHVHFNEPGRTDWEGAATGSLAFAAAGGTLFFDMPLNSSPCTVTASAFDEKCAALSRVLGYRLCAVGRNHSRQSPAISLSWPIEA